MIKLLDQTTNRDMMYACTIYTQLHILMFDYNIRIEDSVIFKLVYYMEKLGKIVLTEWAYFNVIYPAVAAVISWYYGIKLEVRKTKEPELILDNKYDLTGTPKQISFATSIIDKFIKNNKTDNDINVIIQDKKDSVEYINSREYLLEGIIPHYWQKYFEPETKDMKSKKKKMAGLNFK